MTNSQSAEMSHPEPSVEIRWPDDDGPWRITVHWSEVNGRPAIVGLDIRGYDKPTEVTQAMLRGVLITKLRDLTREVLIPHYVTVGLGVLDITAEPEWAAERLSTLTAKGEPRQRRPPATEDLLRRVAALYTEAVGAGDKAPAKYVEDQLRAKGEQRLSVNPASARVLVRQWIRRARERGYLPPNGGTK